MIQPPRRVRPLRGGTRGRRIAPKCSHASLRTNALIKRKGRIRHIDVPRCGGLMKIDIRKDQRHEIPDPCRKYLTFTVTQEQGPVTAVIGNFSRNGILFECSRQFPEGDRAECSLRVNTGTPREITFGIEVRYCYENNGTFIIGASIHAISQDKWFDAFEKLFDMIVTRQSAS